MYSCLSKLLAHYIEIELATFDRQFIPTPVKCLLLALPNPKILRSLPIPQLNPLP